ncbi:hypothetical protein HMPREF0797_2116 [Staphylococcus epidermidis SK135]|nr:hypothetical protein HMPREF0789_0653 [Staphylococcus epidermidis BCM-HMP0060]EFA88046.1 hypothetical protein HMPREF0797_2116 [Staphylococcus epidermidis SK135]
MILFWRQSYLLKILFIIISTSEELPFDVKKSIKQLTKSA